MTVSKYGFLVLGLILLLHLPVQAADSDRLIFNIPGSAERSFSLGQMKTRLKVQTVNMIDPHYGSKKRYFGFKLVDVLNLGFGQQWRDEAFSDITFTALDGYQAISPLSPLKEAGGFVVFADLDVPGWQPIGRSRVSPGPFYLVWKGKKQLTANGYPWPWQLKTLSLVRFADQYAALQPVSNPVADPDNVNGSVQQGLALFKQRCLRCHAISGQGGKVGPDLNAPQNILAYRSENMVKAFIRAPSQFRHSHMPDHRDLSEAQLDSLIDYLRDMGRRR